MSAPKRKPALSRPGTGHPADALPERPPATPPPAAAAQPAPTPTPSGAGSSTAADSERETLSVQHNVRLRPSTQARLRRAVDRLRYETGDRRISISSITDDAITAYLDKHNC